MKTIHQTVEEYLEDEPRARERKNKDRALVNLLLKNYDELSLISKETLIAAIQEYSTMDRAWRKILLEREELRGSDYAMKEILEQKKQIDLEYTPGYHKDVATLKTLFG